MTTKRWKKYTTKDVCDMASQKGFRFVSKSFEKVTDKCDWQCQKCDYTWKAQIRKIKNYKGCPRCTGRIYTREDVVYFALQKNIVLLSDNYTVLNDLYKWQCNKCHYKWQAQATWIVNFSGCPRCSKRAPYSIEELKEIVKTKYLELLDSSYKGMNNKYLCRCFKCNHIWNTLIRKATRCPKCSLADRVMPLVTTIVDAKKIGKDRGFKFVSDIFLGMKKKHRWECGLGHVWMSTVDNIRRGTNCPTCSRKLRTKTCKCITEKRVRSIFEQLTQKLFPSDWHSLGNGQQLDGYCKELNIAFEYNGPQHYCVDGYWNKEKEDLERQQNRDARKTKICQQLNIPKIDVPYTVAKPTKRLHKFIENELRIRGVL